MPRPDVNVAMVQPQVEVKQAPPRVQVTQPQQPQIQVQKPAEAQVSVQSGTSPNIQIQDDSTAPTVHYDRADPRIVVNQAQGKPTVNVEQAEADGRQQEAKPQNGTPQATRQAPTATGAVPSQGIAVSRIKNKEIYNERGDRIGVVEHVVRSDDGKWHLVLGKGGFLGLGEKLFIIQAEDVALRGDRFVVEHLTDDQLKKMPTFDSNNRGFHEAEGNAVMQISSR
jgi:sporulation protein YlmC with PRC-barrel domain